MKKIKDIPSYIAGYPVATQKMLHAMHRLIMETAPGSESLISYEIPAYKIYGERLVYYAAFKNHIGFYPRVSGMEKFKKELSQYKVGKGSVQFPLSKPLPAALIKRMVKFRAKENLLKAGKLKTCAKGHPFKKSSNCPVCPICEKERKPSSGFLSKLSAPARRALENKSILNLKKLSSFSESEILALHGMGPSSIPILKNELGQQGLTFKNK